MNFDFIIIGSGAAGLSAAQYAARANLATVVLEGAAVGGQSLVITDLENYPGVFPPLSGFEFMENMRKQAEAFGAKILGESAQAIERKDGLFFVKTDKNTYASGAVLLASGAEHRSLGIPGEKEFFGRGVSYCASCDGPFFKNKRITVIGGGDSACDEANYLARLSPQVSLVHRRDTLRAQAGVAERVLNNPNIKTFFNYVPLEIRGSNRVESIVLKHTVSGELLVRETDAVFVFIGITPKTALAGNVEKDAEGYIITDESMQTSIKGLFCAGDVRAKPFRQVVTAAADGAVAAFSAGKYLSEVRISR